MEISSILALLSDKRDLSAEQMEGVFDALMSGKLTDVEISAFLMGLNVKGITADELASAAKVMRSKVTRIPITVDAIDTCGTGGDGISTFNVSTASAIVSAAAGAYVAKHGNRTNTRKSGSAEVLAALGVNLDADISTVKRCIEEAHIGFCYAIKLHPAMKYAANVRKALKIRTIFNLLGPLTNPAGVRRQIIGVSRPELVELIANALNMLGVIRGMVVHGLDGLCDITISGPTKIAEIENGKISYYEISPEDFGLTRARIDDILINSPEESAHRIKEVFAGKKGSARDIVLLNSAAGLVIAGLVDDMRSGIELASEAIDAGKASNTLTHLIDLSNR